MSRSTNRRRLTGYALHALIGGLMIAAGAPKLLGLAPAEHVRALGLTEHVRVVGAGEIVTGALLVIPATASLGILLTSAFWGGAICVHMTHGDSYLVPSVVLALSWAGAYLRIPALFGNVRRGEMQAATLAAGSPS